MQSQVQGLKAGRFQARVKLAPPYRVQRAQHPPQRRVDPGYFHFTGLMGCRCSTTRKTRVLDNVSYEKWKLSGRPPTAAPPRARGTPTRRRGRLAGQIRGGAHRGVGVQSSQLKPALETGVFIKRFQALNLGGAFKTWGGVLSTTQRACTALPGGLRCGRNTA